jgi:hypothetical protein
MTQSHATLFGVDCRGRLYPRLAQSWSLDVATDGWRWTMTLRDDVHFWNGERVTASGVLAAWRATAEGTDGELARVVADASKVVDDRTLCVTLADSTPQTLADPKLGIALRPQPSMFAPRVRVRSIDPTAARDALDAGADLLVTDDPAIVSYAAQRDELLTFPLPWDRTYVVLAAESSSADVTTTRRLTLAESVVHAARADARVAQPPFWWESSGRCTALIAASPGTAAHRSTRVVYRAGDRVAQGLAERLVALAGRRPERADSVLARLLPALSRAGARAMAVALSPSAFAAATRAGEDLAYVLPLPRVALAPCHELSMLQRAAPWLNSARVGPRVIALVDARSIAIVRRGRLGLSVDADGGLRILDGTPGKTGER